MHNIFQLNPKKKKTKIKSNLPKLSKFTKKKKKERSTDDGFACSTYDELVYARVVERGGGVAL